MSLSASRNLIDLHLLVLAPGHSGSLHYASAIVCLAEAGPLTAGLREARHVRCLLQRRCQC